MEPTTRLAPGHHPLSPAARQNFVSIGVTKLDDVTAIAVIDGDDLTADPAIFVPTNEGATKRRRKIVESTLFPSLVCLGRHGALLCDVRAYTRVYANK